MSTPQPLEGNAKLDQHLASHNYAERLYERALQLIEDGHDPAQVRDAVKELHRRARESNQVIQRDAYVEVLDALDEEYPGLSRRPDQNPVR